MDNENGQPQKQRQHHFLFYIFNMDKAENPMPQSGADTLLHYLKHVFTESLKRDKGE